MKIRFTFFLLLVLFLQSCSDSSNDYKDSIEKWLETNLNDPESYEPIDYEILDSSYLEYGNLEFSNYASAIQRRADLSNLLEKHLKDKKENENFDDFYSLNDSIIDKINYMWNFKKIKELNEKILQKFQNRNDKNYSSDQYYLTIISQIEGTNERINLTKDRLEESLDSNCLSDNPGEKIQNGLLIKHRFRAKNAFGAKIINERIFELNSDKSLVLKSCEVE